ncbi:MAG: NADP-dependent oxidoreductase [Streptosporangiaceae bacterium]
MAEPGSGLAVRLARRPQGVPTPDCFEVVPQPAPELAAGEVVVRNEFFSLDPYMRGRMSDAKSYAAPYELGEIMHGDAVGRVVASADPAIPVGASVVHSDGWRAWSAGPAAQYRVVDTAKLSPTAYLGPLGLPGFTAYVGMKHIAGVREGDVVFVSAAAGAVGSLAGQVARQLGASQVVGSAGSAAKIAVLTGELGFDAAFNYKDGNLSGQLRTAANGRIDVYFDNVGGEQLEVAIGAMARWGRIALCGMISVYNETVLPPGPGNLGMLIGKRLVMRGFLVTDHEDLRGEFEQAMTGWLSGGSVRATETVVTGVEHAPQAFNDLFTGGNTGKLLVRVKD